MNLKLKKSVAVLLVFAVVFAFSMPAFAAAYSLSGNEDMYNQLSMEKIQDVWLDYVYQSEDNEAMMYERGIPILVTVAGIRAALVLLGAASRFIYTSAHALQRLNERGFTNAIVANLMNSGTRFTNAQGQRILYSNGNALVLDNTGRTVITAYNRVNLSAKQTGNAGWVYGWR